MALNRLVCVHNERECCVVVCCCVLCAVVCRCVLLLLMFIQQSLTNSLFCLLLLLFTALISLSLSQLCPFIFLSLFACLPAYLPTCLPAYLLSYLPHSSFFCCTHHNDLSLHPLLSTSLCLIPLFSICALSSTLFTVNSFRCAKCKNRVECDSNLLLLSDGSPICEQCSYSCNACRKPILDEAIMTGKPKWTPIHPAIPHSLPWHE